MDITFNRPRLSGEIPAISSKSEAHRQLICSAFSDAPTRIICTDTNNDIDATVSCLNSLGASIKRTSDSFFVEPIASPKSNAELDCGESGSTLRFLIPIIAALGVDAKINMHGRLPKRPLSPLYELLESNGVKMSRQGENPFCISGRLKSGNYSIAANVSSQFISGLLFALSLVDGDSTLTLEGNVESKNYIDMTLDAISLFGGNIVCEDNKFTIKSNGKFTSPKETTVGGDWSNAAFFLCAGALSENPVTVTGLDVNSSQGDKAILDVLSRMGAKIHICGDKITVSREKHCGIDLDASQIPDLVPIIATVASVADGKTVIHNAARLKIKESDRILSTCNMIQALGGNATPTDDGMIILGCDALLGGNIDSANDHRIAMSGAIASIVCSSPITISGFEAINKSYPKFKDDFYKLTLNGEI